MTKKKEISLLCDKCGLKYIQKFYRGHFYCLSCYRLIRGEHNYGKK